MEIKGIHIDLKAQTMKFGFLCRQLVKLSELGFNTILLEYQDKFPYSGEYACLAGPDAYTLNEVEQLKSLCRTLGMEIIPMVQCIGHMYWVTRFDRLCELGEEYSEIGKGSHSLCASDERSIQLFYALSSQVMAVHGESKYFHIGGDEVKFSDTCPKCSKAPSHGELLGEYYRKAVTHVSANGFIPAMWGDMVIKYEAVADSLPKDTLILDWMYHKGLTEANARRFYGEAKPWCVTDNTSFETTAQLVAKGFDVLVSPALRSMGDSQFIPRNIHLDNCVQAFYTAHDTGAKGIMLTSWSVRRSPWQLTEPVINVISQLFRNPDAAYADTLKVWSAKTYGTPDDASLGEIGYILADAVEKAMKTAEFLSAGQNYMDAETGMFIPRTLRKRTIKVDIRGNDEVIKAYTELRNTAVRLGERLCEYACENEYTAMLMWAIENAKFYGGLVSELCENTGNAEVLGELKVRLDEFAPSVEVLSKYYTGFSMPSEYLSRVEVYREFIDRFVPVSNE